MTLTRGSSSRPMFRRGARPEITTCAPSGVLLGQATVVFPASRLPKTAVGTTAIKTTTKVSPSPPRLIVLSANETYSPADSESLPSIESLARRSMA